MKPNRLSLFGAYGGKYMLQVGDRVEISGYTDELWIEDYHVRVSSGATVEETPGRYDKKVLVTIDEIDGDRNVCIRVRRSKIQHAERGE